MKELCRWLTFRKVKKTKKTVISELLESKKVPTCFSSNVKPTSGLASKKTWKFIGGHRRRNFCESWNFCVTFVVGWWNHAFGDLDTKWRLQLTSSFSFIFLIFRCTFSPFTAFLNKTFVKLKWKFTFCAFWPHREKSVHFEVKFTLGSKGVVTPLKSWNSKILHGFIWDFATMTLFSEPNAVQNVRTTRFMIEISQMKNYWKSVKLAKHSKFSENHHINFKIINQENSFEIPKKNFSGEHSDENIRCFETSKCNVGSHFSKCDKTIFWIQD